MSFLVKPVVGAIVGGLVGRAVAGGSRGGSIPPRTPTFWDTQFTPEQKASIATELFQPMSIPSIHVPTIYPQSSPFYKPFLSDLRGIQSSIGALNAQAGRFDPIVFQQIDRLRGDITGLRETVKPGFSDIREARLSAVERARKRTLSDTKDDLARRGVAGSSFGRGLVAGQELGFANQAAEQAALSYIEELSANIELIDMDRQLVQHSIDALAAQTQARLGAAQAAVEKARITGTAMSADVQSRQAAAIAEAEAQARVLAIRQQDLQRRTLLFGELERLSAENDQFNRELAFRDAEGRGNLIGTFTGIGADIGSAWANAPRTAGGTISGGPLVPGAITGSSSSPALTTPYVGTSGTSYSVPRLPVTAGSFTDLLGRTRSQMPFGLWNLGG